MLDRLRRWPRRALAAAVVAAVSMLVACSSGGDPEPTASPSPEHRIGVRDVGAGPEFFDTATGETFIARGPNLHRFGVEPPGVVVDTLFVPGRYDPAWVDSQFDQIVELGYNAVRTSFDVCGRTCIGSASGGLDAAYLDNVVDLLWLAHDHGLQVFLTSNDLPAEGGFVPAVEATGGALFDGYINSQYFHPDAYAVYRDYWVSLVQGLLDRDAPMDAVAGYQVRGEFWQFGDTPPLSLTSGSVTTANGSSYDLADPVARAALLADGTTFWLDSIRDAIRAIDPTALVGVGVFAPNTPNVWHEDSRVIDMPAVWSSAIDFVDVHVYPGYVGFDALAQNLGLDASEPAKPTLFAEFGAFTFAFDSPERAAIGLMDWQVESCAYHAEGWFHWHWQGEDDHEVWTGTDGSNIINSVLSPAERPDPCARADFPGLETNIARRASVTASSADADHPPSLAVDGVVSTSWQSGAEPPAWIRLDLAETSTVAEVQLTPDQYPAGRTVHRLSLLVDGGWREVQVFDGDTTAGGTLTWTPDSPVAGVTAVRVDSVTSPSFISWFEVAVIAPAVDS